MIKNKHLMKFSALKLGLVSLTVGVLSTVLPIGPASAVDQSICHSPTFGGDYYCGYTKGPEHYPLSYIFPDKTWQVFVIGKDFSVWTRWATYDPLFGYLPKNYSNWVSLGGQIRKTYSPSDFGLGDCGGHPYVVVNGLDNKLWSRYRQDSGVWTGWAHYTGYLCAAP